MTGQEGARARAASEKQHAIIVGPWFRNALPPVHAAEVDWTEAIWFRLGNGLGLHCPRGRPAQIATWAGG